MTSVEMNERTPAYQVVPQNENADEPPSYNRLFPVTQLRELMNDSDRSPVQKITSLSTILCTSCLSTVCFAIFSIIPIAQIVVGIMSRDKCIIQRHIPTWNIVAGSVGLGIVIFRVLATLINMIRNCSDKEGQSAKDNPLISCIVHLASFFSIGWFIYGNVIVYSIYSNVQYDETLYPDRYCDKLCYLFSFWIITANWILLVGCCVCLCGLCCAILGAGCIFGACIK